MRGDSGGDGQTGDGDEERAEPGERTLEQAVKRSKRAMKQMFTGLEKAFQPKKEHVLLTLFAIKKQFVFVIITGIKGQFADGVLYRRPNCRQHLIDPVAFPERDAGIRVKTEVMGQRSMIARNRLKVLFLSVSVKVINPCLS